MHKEDEKTLEQVAQRDCKYPSLYLLKITWLDKALRNLI